MLGIFAVKSAVLRDSVSDPAESSGLIDLLLIRMLYVRMLLQWNIGLI